jgi:hypothetical protein
MCGATTHVCYGSIADIAVRARFIAPRVRAPWRNCRLLRRVRPNEFSATRAGAADLDHRGLTYFNIVSDICGLGIEASRRQLFKASSFGRTVTSRESGWVSDFFSAESITISALGHKRTFVLQ